MRLSVTDQEFALLRSYYSTKPGGAEQFAFNVGWAERAEVILARGKGEKMSFALGQAFKEIADPTKVGRDAIADALVFMAAYWEFTPELMAALDPIEEAIVAEGFAELIARQQDYAALESNSESNRV